MTKIEDQFSLDDLDGGSSSGFGSSSSAPIRGTVQVGKIEYAVDLQWETPRDASKAAKEAVQHASNQTDRANFFCIRKGTKTQFALGFSSMGHRTNQPSLAAHICQNKGASFVAIYELEDGGFYLLAVRDDTILSDSERYIQDQSDAFEALNRLMGQYDFSEVVAPAGFEIDGARVQTLQSVLIGKASVRLQDVSTNSKKFRLIVIGGLVVAAFLGGRYYLDQQERDRLAQEALAQLEAAQQATGLKKEEVIVPPMPWENQPIGTHILETCYNEIQKFPLDIPGWTVDRLDCTPLDDAASIGVFINRDKNMNDAGSTLMDALQMSQFNGLKPLLTHQNTGSNGPFGFQWSVGGHARIPADIETAKIGEITTAVLYVMESRHTNVIFSSAEEDDWSKAVNIEFSTNLSPLGYVDILDAIPAFMLTSLEYDIKTNRYTIKGKAYEQKPLPENAVKR
jgi:hypothetical protein